MAIFYGLLIGFIAWMLFTIEPFLDTSGFNSFLGLSNFEAAIVALFFIVGVHVGILGQTIDKISKAHDQLANKVYGREQ